MSSMTSNDNSKKNVGTRTRVITSLFILPILILPIYFGGYPIYILLLLITLAGQYELLRGFKIKEKPIFFITGLNSVVYYFLIFSDMQHLMMAVITAFVVSLLMYYVLIYPKLDFKIVTQSIISFLYINVMLTYILLIRINEPYGVWFVWLVFLISFGSDTFAYFAGRKFGKHKLAEKLSPKKTIEGAIGGVLGAITLTAMYGFMMHYMGVIDDYSKLPYLAILGGFGSILSILGDLVASAIKRQNNIKDFGSLLPGHGGIMDRFDSNIFTAPFVYYIMVVYFVI